MGWWGKKMLNVLAAAPSDIRVVRAVEPNLETARALCAEKGVALTADYADALADPDGRSRRAGDAACAAWRADRGCGRGRKARLLRKAAGLDQGRRREGGSPVPRRGLGSRNGARAAMGAADRRAAGQGRRRGTGAHSPDRSQLQSRQVPGARPGQLAPEGRPGAGWRDDRHRHPSARSVGAPARPGRKRAGAFASSSRRTCRRATPSPPTSSFGAAALPTFRPRLPIRSYLVSRSLARKAGSTFATRRMSRRPTAGSSHPQWPAARSRRSRSRPPSR